ncbi:DotU family type IV/VI secretion system protein [bacterium]|nr:DotU family type IV/VI secretion system protein [bacterium]
MTDSDRQDRLLLEFFREFHITLERLKECAQSGNYVYSNEQIKQRAEQIEEKITVSSNTLYRELVTLFENQQLTANRLGNEMGNKLYSEALFVMTAIADEVFLTMNWAGQEAWSKFLLETKFFGSNAGGDIFFNKLDSLLKERDLVYAELATMFLLALSLGFRGKYLGVNDDGVIDNYKEQIYSFIYKNPPDLNPEDKRLFPQAYLNTLIQESKMMIPGLKKWYGFVFLLLISLIGVSHIIWIQMTNDISKIVSQILGG